MDNRATSSSHAHARLANGKLAESFLREESDSRIRKSGMAESSFLASDNVRLYDKIDKIKVQIWILLMIDQEIVIIGNSRSSC